MGIFQSYRLRLQRKRWRIRAFRKRREAMKEREAEFLQAAFDRTFGDWDEKDWKKVQDQYYKSI